MKRRYGKPNNYTKGGRVLAESICEKCWEWKQDCTCDPEFCENPGCRFDHYEDGLCFACWIDETGNEAMDYEDWCRSVATPRGIAG